MLLTPRAPSTAAEGADVQKPKSQAGHPVPSVRALIAAITAGVSLGRCLKSFDGSSTRICFPSRSGFSSSTTTRAMVQWVPTYFHHGDERHVGYEMDLAGQSGLLRFTG